MQNQKEEFAATCAKIATIGRDLKIWRAAVDAIPNALLQDLTHSTKQLQQLTSATGNKDLIASVQVVNQHVQQIIRAFQDENPKETCPTQQFDTLIRDLVTQLMKIKVDSVCFFSLLYFRKPSIKAFE